MNHYSEHADGIRSLIDELGDSCPAIDYFGVKIQVLPSPARRGGGNSIGGQMLDADFEFTALIEDFQKTPVNGEKFTYEGTFYRIDNVNFAPGREQVRISAVFAAQKL